MIKCHYCKNIITNIPDPIHVWCAHCDIHYSKIKGVVIIQFFRIVKNRQYYLSVFPGKIELGVLGSRQYYQVIFEAPISPDCNINPANVIDKINLYLTFI